MRGAQARAAAVLWVALISPTLVLGTPERAEAQVLPAVLGGVGGLIAGTHVTTGVFVLKSRATGWVMHSVETLVEPSPELLPLVAGPIAGALLGARSTDRLESAGLWGGAGLLSGSAVGALAGHLLWGNAEGRWAGAVIGSASGLLIGAIVGAAYGGDESEPGGGAPEMTPAVRFVIPVPW